MKRIKELIEEINKKYPDDNFFENFERRCQDNLFRKYYNAYNKALMALDDESWQILKGKALRHFLDHREGQMKQGFFNILNEAFAYQYLAGKGFQNITFAKEEKNKRTQDLTFYIKGSKSCCEVKTLGISKKEINRREAISTVHYNDNEHISDEFLNKLSSTINSTSQQISNFGPNSLIYIIINFDDLFLIYFRNYKEELIRYCKDQKYENLIIKIGCFENEITFMS